MEGVRGVRGVRGMRGVKGGRCMRCVREECDDCDDCGGMGVVRGGRNAPGVGWRNVMHGGSVGVMQWWEGWFLASEMHTGRTCHV